MTLHIRDFRQSDAAALSRLGDTGNLLGNLPWQESDHRILVGRREDSLVGAVWVRLEGKTGIIPAIHVAPSKGWHSQVRELIAEAVLWLASRGAAHIELQGIPEDEQLHAELLDMNFRWETRRGVFLRLIPASSAA